MAAPHQNGCAEALVKSAKISLKKAIGEQILTPFELYTCLLEVANLCLLLQGALNSIWKAIRLCLPNKSASRRTFSRDEKLLLTNLTNYSSQLAKIR